MTLSTNCDDESAIIAWPCPFRWAHVRAIVR